MNDKKCYTVYMHINKINGKKYVGITHRTIEDRWRNGNGYKTGSFRAAINKYGWEGFEHKVIESNLSESNAKALEIYYIDFFKTRERGCGYNLKVGGDIHTGYRHSEEAKKKISQAVKNMSEETREKYRVARSKQVITAQHKQHMSESRKGMKFTNEHLANLSESHKGNKGFWEGKSRDIETINKIKQKLSKKVECIETGEIYSSVTEASQKTGYALSCISKWCNGTKPKCANFTFKFYEKE